MANEYTKPKGRKKLSFSEVGVFAFLLFGQLAAKATGFALFVEEGTLAGTSACKFSVLFHKNFDRYPGDGEAEQNQTDEE